MVRKWIAGVALAVAGVGAPSLASADPQTTRPLIFDCGSVGKFVYAVKQGHPMPSMGELDGHKVKVGYLYANVYNFGSQALFEGQWPAPKNPNLTAVTCHASYRIPGPSEMEDIYVYGEATIYARPNLDG